MELLSPHMIEATGFTPVPGHLYFFLHRSICGYDGVSKTIYHPESTIKLADGTFEWFNSSHIKVYRDPDKLLTEQPNWTNVAGDVWLYTAPNMSDGYARDSAYTLIDNKPCFVIRKEDSAYIEKIVPRKPFGKTVYEDGSIRDYRVLYYKSPSLGSNMRGKRQRISVHYSQSKISIYHVELKITYGAYLTRHGKVRLWTSNNGHFRTAKFLDVFDVIIDSWLQERVSKGARVDKYKLRFRKIVEAGEYANWLLKKHPILKDVSMNSNALVGLKFIPLQRSFRDYCHFFTGSSSGAVMRYVRTAENPETINALRIILKAKLPLRPELIKVISKSRIPKEKEKAVVRFLKSLPSNFRWSDCISTISTYFNLHQEWHDTIQMVQELTAIPKLTGITLENVHRTIMDIIINASVTTGTAYHFAGEFTDPVTGIHFRTPTSSGEVRAWGRFQSHCIGGYAENRNTLLLQITHKDRPVAHCALNNPTLTSIPHPFDIDIFEDEPAEPFKPIVEGTWTPVQVYYSRNRALDPGYEKRIIDALSRAGVYFGQNYFGYRQREGVYLADMPDFNVELNREASKDTFPFIPVNPVQIA